MDYKYVIFITILFELYMNETEQNRILLLLDAEDEFECSSDVDDDVEANPNFEMFSEHFSES